MEVQRTGNGQFTQYEKNNYSFNINYGIDVKFSFSSESQRLKSGKDG